MVGFGNGSIWVIFVRVESGRVGLTQNTLPKTLKVELVINNSFVRYNYKNYTRIILMIILCVFEQNKEVSCMRNTFG